MSQPPEPAQIPLMVQWSWPLPATPQVTVGLVPTSGCLAWSSKHVRSRQAHLQPAICSRLCGFSVIKLQPVAKKGDHGVGEGIVEAVAPMLPIEARRQPRRGVRRSDLSEAARRIGVADAAEGFPAAQYRLRLLPGLDRGRDLCTRPRRALSPDPGAGGPRREPDRGDHRQPERENRRGGPRNGRIRRGKSG